MARFLVLLLVFGLEDLKYKLGERATKMVAESEKKITAPEKRLSKRYNCASTIKWSHFNTQNCYPASAMNFSKTGLYFESTRAVDPGSTILIRTEEFPSENSNSDGQAYLRTICLAEVKWCRELEGTSVTLYGVGAKYHMVF